MSESKGSTGSTVKLSPSAYRELQHLRKNFMDRGANLPPDILAIVRGDGPSARDAYALGHVLHAAIVIALGNVGLSAEAPYEPLDLRGLAPTEPRPAPLTSAHIAAATYLRPTTQSCADDDAERLGLAPPDMTECGTHSVGSDGHRYVATRWFPGSEGGPVYYWGLARYTSAASEDEGRE